MLSVKYIERKSYKRERRDSNISHDFTRNTIHVHYNRPSYQTASQWLIVTRRNNTGCMQCCMLLHDHQSCINLLERLFTFASCDKQAKITGLSVSFKTSCSHTQHFFYLHNYVYPYTKAWNSCTYSLLALFPGSSLLPRNNFTYDL